MGQPDDYVRIFFGKTGSQMLCAIYRTMLSSGAAEAYHKACESTARISLDVRFNYSIHMVQEADYFPVVFQKADDRLIPARQFLIRDISSWIMDGAAVKDISSPISGKVTRYTFLI